MGRYRFFFFSNEAEEPPHIHVKAAEHEAKYWLLPVELAANFGFVGSELTRIEELVEEHVDDLMEAMLKAVALIGCTQGKVYNIGGGPTRTISVWTEFREYLRPLLRSNPEARLYPWRPGDQRIYVSDIRRVQRDLDWRPEVTIAEGLRKMIKDWQHSGVPTAEARRRSFVTTRQSVAGGSQLM